jgi:hypothetical protein
MTFMPAWWARTAPYGAGGGCEKLPAVKDATGIATNDDATCVVRRGGPPRCFGTLVVGEELHTMRELGGTTALAIAHGLGCALDKDGQARCIGDLRNILDARERSGPLTPLRTPGLFAKLTLGDDFGCALRADGEVICFGAWSRGQLGSGERSDSARPTIVLGIPPLVR